MATYSSSSSNACIDFLEQAKQNFWSSHRHLSEDELQVQWQNAAAAMASNALGSAQYVPRSMPVYTTNMTQQLLSSSFEYMDRTRSSPATGSATSPTAMDDSNLQRSTTAYPAWQSMSQDPASDYDLYSDASMRSSLAYPPVEEYNVAEFLEQARLSPSLPLSQNPQQLHMQLTPEMQWSPSSDGSTSPSTPLTALMTPSTHSNAMSRRSSYNPNFLQTPMLRIQSDSSCTMPILSEDADFPVSYVSSKAISSDVDSSSFFFPTGSANGDFISPASQFFSASTYALASSSNEQPGLAEDMRRSASTSSSESNVSDASAPSSTSSRHSQRNREIKAHASRLIAPKAMESSHQAESALSNAQMAKIRSEDGSSKTVGVITKSKSPYVRPHHPKIMCQYCNERPDGFRGTHELDRHIARAHASRRKGYICVDYFAEKKFLSNCKHCRGKKVYGAYYNAAAHLRRAHFHPRKRGRKGKNDEKRGGIGGGDHPAMDWLKQHWIQEIEVDNKPVPQSPDSASDDAPDAADATYDAAYDMDTAYPSSSPQQQQQQQMPAVDPSQYMAAYMNASAEPMVMYNNTTPFTPVYNPSIAAATSSDMQNFQFDADAQAF